MRRIPSARLLWLLLAPYAIAAGPLTVQLEHDRPVLCWPNTQGYAYVIETTTNLNSQVWQKRLTITSDALDLSWADDNAPLQAMFYRVTPATNATPFVTLQQALHRACTNQGIVGASAAVSMPAYGLWLGTCGTSDGSVPIRPQTPFEIGSVTKTLVAVTILRLVEEGRLRLEDTVGTWLPDLNQPNVSPGITVRQLLGHRSGVHNFGDDPGFRVALFGDWTRRWEPEEVFSYVRAPHFAPGADGQYSNTGYVLLGMIIRRATGSSVTGEMRRTVLQRAGLRSTFMGGEEQWDGALANPHLDFDGDGYHEDLGALSQTAILTSFWTSGAEISTPADMARLGISLFEGDLLTPNSLTAMRTFQSIDIGGSRYDYGLGLMKFDILGREHWAHSGGLFGEYGWLSYCPSTRACLALAYNHPVVKAGPSLPSELLIALSTLAATAPGAALAPDSSHSLRIPFLTVDPVVVSAATGK